MQQAFILQWSQIRHQLQVSKLVYTPDGRGVSKYNYQTEVQYDNTNIYFNNFVRSSAALSCTDQRGYESVSCPLNDILCRPTCRTDIPQVITYKKSKVSNKGTWVGVVVVWWSGLDKTVLVQA